jgi:hypothetical protein
MPRTKKSVVEPAAPEAGNQPEVNKTKAVRDYLKQNPGALPVAVSEALKAQGVDVNPKYVSNVKFKLGIKKRRTKAVAKGEGATPAAAVAPTDMISVAALQKAKKLVQEIGGVQQAKQALAALGQLLD